MSLELGSIESRKLLEAAREVRKHSYSPYSEYRVGAAILGENGKVYSGCNIENVSYGLTICAERAAIAQMVSDGCYSILAVAVVTKDGGSPCGMCRQVILEFTKDGSTPVFCSDEQDLVVRFTIDELIPHGFRSSLP